MLKPFVCGTFNPIDDDELCTISSPRRYKRKDSKNNPYSTRGLDKFSALLSELNDKRQKIYSQMNPHDISYVRFVHSSKDDFVPIIVKVKNKSQEIKAVKARNLENSSSDHQSSSVVTMEKRNQPKRRISMNVKKIEMDKAMVYLAFVVIMVLLMLTVFGRTVTTVFTCVLWYANPTMKDGSLSSRSSMKKKDFVRGLSEKNMVSEGMKKKDYGRWFSERKMEISEGVNEKKKDYVRRWSEKNMVSGTNDGLVSPISGGDSDEAKSKNKKIHGKRSHKKS
ncbi:uncharacterized protein LOC131596474 [Vicia villosa]|uniref:uncharacterized protein LOC131596474 n=1 Tax=Vicia villosa TaxID=3911 RepID=UPI00273B9149|nr:uncharacterized protein LOC131596474 [Vicia villosa]